MQRLVGALFLSCTKSLSLWTIGLQILSWNLIRLIDCSASSRHFGRLSSLSPGFILLIAARATWYHPIHSVLGLWRAVATAAIPELFNAVCVTVEYRFALELPFSER
jgi:hypothetical protein